MATKEIIENTTVLKNDKCANIDFAKQYLDSARDQLLFRRFDDCVKTCENGIIRAKLEDNGNPDLVEALCVVGIQAYAELNKWQQVLPFVQKVYGSIEDCPYIVIQLCIVLHAKVEEYSQCFAIASVWLKNVKNFTDPHYVTLVEIYITNVLIPGGHKNLIDPFLETCPGLTSDQKTDLYNKCSKIEITPAGHEENIQEIDTEESRENASKPIPKTVKDSWLITLMKNIKFALFGNAPLYSFSLVKMTIIAVCLYLIAMQNQKGFLIGNFERVGHVFQGMVKVFKSLFGPRTFVTS